MPTTEEIDAFTAFGTPNPKNSQIGTWVGTTLAAPSRVFDRTIPEFGNIRRSPPQSKRRPYERPYSKPSKRQKITPSAPHIQKTRISVDYIIPFNKAFPPEIMSFIFLEAACSIPLFYHTLIILEKDISTGESRWLQHAQEGYMYCRIFRDRLAIPQLNTWMHSPRISPQDGPKKVHSVYVNDISPRYDSSQFFALCPNLNTLAIPSLLFVALVNPQWGQNRTNHGKHIATSLSSTDALDISLIDGCHTQLWVQTRAGSIRNEDICNRITHLSFFRLYPRHGLSPQDFPNLTHVAFPHMFASEVFSLRADKGFAQLTDIVLLVSENVPDYLRMRYVGGEDRDIKDTIETVLLAYLFKDRRVRVLPFELDPEGKSDNDKTATFWEEHVGRGRSLWDNARRYTLIAVKEMMKNLRFDATASTRLERYLKHAALPPLPLPDGTLPLSSVESVYIDPVHNRVDGVQSFIARLNPKSIAISSRLFMAMFGADSLSKESISCWSDIHLTILNNIVPPDGVNVVWPDYPLIPMSSVITELSFKKGLPAVVWSLFPSLT